MVIAFLAIPNILISQTLQPGQTIPDEKIVEGPNNTVLCSCVKGVRLHMPDLPRGDAGTFTPNTTPKVGVAVLFTYSNGVEHIAYVDSINSEGFHVIHYNKTHCQKTDEWVSWNNPYVRGFYLP